MKSSSSDESSETSSAETENSSLFMSDDSYYDECENIDSLPLNNDELEEENNKKYMSIIEPKSKDNKELINIQKESKKLETVFFVADILNMHLHND